MARFSEANVCSLSASEVAELLNYAHELAELKAYKAALKIEELTDEGSMLSSDPEYLAGAGLVLARAHATSNLIDALARFVDRCSGEKEK